MRRTSVFPKEKPWRSRIHFGGAEIKLGFQAGLPAWAGKKKMRTLGTVQLPTEAFMAVLKLDE